VDYGALNTGSFLDKTFAISNAGTADLSVHSRDPGPARTLPSSLSRAAADRSLWRPRLRQNMVVRFSPASSGAKSASLSFTSNDSDENPFFVSLSGTGVTPGETHPDIASDPASWDYGALNTGSFLDKTFVISNAGTADLSVTAVTLSGANASEFFIQSGGGPFTLTPAATRNVWCGSALPVPARKSASLSFTSNDPGENPFLVSLNGGGEVLIIVDGNKDGFYSMLTGPENGYLNIPPFI